MQTFPAYPKTICCYSIHDVKTLGPLIDKKQNNI